MLQCVMWCITWCQCWEISMCDQCETNVKPKANVKSIWGQCATNSRSMWIRSETNIRLKWDQCERKVRSLWGQFEMNVRCGTNVRPMRDQWKTNVRPHKQRRPSPTAEPPYQPPAGLIGIHEWIYADRVAEVMHAISITPPEYAYAGSLLFPKMEARISAY